MPTVRVRCPHCETQFRVPRVHLGRKGRCAECQAVFVLSASDLEDSVMEWLALEEIQGQAQAQAAPQAAPPVQAVRGGPATARPAVSPARAEPARRARGAPTQDRSRSGMLRLAHVDAMGAFFTFPSWLLGDSAFRASLPRCCLCCGVTHGLTVHLIVWPSKLPDRDRMGLRNEFFRVSLGMEELAHLSGVQLLEVLPKVPNMPPPFDEPMPYFICHRCSPAGAIMAHVRPTNDTVDECELGIASLRRAAEFLANSLGREHPDYQCLLKEAERRRRDPWIGLPLAVRNRIAQWFSAQEGEKFLCYLRDHDFAQAEAGSGGLVVTSSRLIYHKYAGHHEIPLGQPLVLEVVHKADKFQLRITAPDCHPVTLHCDSGAVDVVRCALRGAGAHFTYRP